MSIKLGISIYSGYSNTKNRAEVRLRPIAKIELK